MASDIPSEGPAEALELDGVRMGVCAWSLLVACVVGALRLGFEELDVYPRGDSTSIGEKSVRFANWEGLDVGLTLLIGEECPDVGRLLEPEAEVEVEGEGAFV
jgi:hypothetical protein